MKYIFRFEMDNEEGIIYEYETDLEPFRSGDLVNLGELLGDLKELPKLRKLDDLFRVKEVWRNPLSPQKEAILFTLEEYKPKP